MTSADHPVPRDRIPMGPATGSGGPPTALLVARGKTGRTGRNLKCGAGARGLLLGACQWGAPLPLSLELGARMNREDRLSGFEIAEPRLVAAAARSAALLPCALA